MGGVLWVLALLPTVVYFATAPERRAPIPAFPILGAFFALYYPLQLLLGTANANEIALLDVTADYHRPAQLTLLGWTAMLIGNAAFALTLRSRHRAARTTWSVDSLKRWAFVLQIGGLAIDAARVELPVPVTIHGILAFAGMLSLFGTAILVVLSARGHLTESEKARLWTVAGAMAVIQIGTGSVAYFARTGVILVLASWIAGKRPRASIVVGALVLASVVVTLRGFVIDFRNQAWWGDEDLSQSRRSALWYALISDHVGRHGVVATVGHGTYVVATRSATLDLYADVVRHTPNSVPYWGGRTYLSLVGAFIPRVIWPGKPQKRLGNEFGHRYGYLSPDDHHTSINLPFPIELYVNFGERGVLFGMFIIGGLLAVLDRALNRPGQDWVRSLCGIVLLVPVVTNIESDFSLVYGGLILEGTALFLVYRFLVRRCTAGANQDAKASSRRDPFLISALMHPAKVRCREGGGQRAVSGPVLYGRGNRDAPQPVPGPGIGRDAAGPTLPDEDTPPAIQEWERGIEPTPGQRSGDQPIATGIAVAEILVAHPTENR